LNLAEYKRLITLSMRRISDSEIFTMPHELSHLECLWLDGIACQGPPLFEATPTAPRLQELILPLVCDTRATFHSSQFPMLRQINAGRLSYGSVVDFSEFKNPGLNICLRSFTAKFKAPPSDVPLGRVTTQASLLLSNASIREMLPRVQRLNFECRGQDDLCFLSRTMHGPPVTREAPFGSANLVEFQLRVAEPLRFGFGSFPNLLHLALINVKTQFTAASAPNLETLMIERADVGDTLPLPSGDFSALLSLTLKNVDVKDGLDLTAPCLKELSFIHVESMHMVVVDRTKYPALQVLTIMQPHQYYVRASEFPEHHLASLSVPHHVDHKSPEISSFSLPRLEATAEPAGLPPLVVNVDCEAPEHEIAQLNNAAGPNVLIFLASYRPLKVHKYYDWRT